MQFKFMIRFQDYINLTRAKGRVYFTNEEAVNELGISHNALNCGMYKLRKKGYVVSPAKNLHIIVPPEYQSMGSLPPEELVPILMKHWELDYYVCLLSAAMFHGASHQKPQVFQVMTNEQIKPLEIGKIKIKFIYKKSLENIKTQNIVVKTGYLKISTPEMTALDLLLYPKQSGGLNHIATVLTELVDSLDAKLFKEIIKNSNEITTIQRFGYILEHLENLENDKRIQIIKNVKNYLKNKKTKYIPLASELPIDNYPKNNDWKIIENSNIESDI